MNLVEIGQAFIEGLALIVSPCILPVLPLVLSTSIDGGRARPFGVITGFVLAFTAFALLSRQLVNAFNIDLDIIKNISLVLLALFALVLLSETLSQKFSAATQRLSNLGGTLSSNAKDGFFSGILIGALIGLVWTPCAGPILAAVLVQVIRQQSDVQALPILVAFAVGAGVPMLLIALTGRRMMTHLGFFTRHAEGVRKTFGVLILIAVAFIATGVDPQTLFAKEEQSAAAQVGLQDGLAKPYAAPEFAPAEAWLNSKPLTMKELRGKVVLVDFWAYSCINCVRTLPYLTDWDKKYRDKGLVIVGVHAPEFEFEKKQTNVEAAVAQRGIRYPVVLDNKLDTWTNFNTQAWPSHYLIDRSGQVVFTHVGEGRYAETENNIRYLLGLATAAASMPEQASYSGNETPETYLGQKRMERFACRGDRPANEFLNFSCSKNLPADAWALQGRWKIEGERIISGEPGAALQINFTSRKVFLVLANGTGEPVRVSVTLNGALIGENAGKDAPAGKLVVRQNTLYELIDQKTTKNGLLEIKAGAPGLEAYAFTFGS